MYATTAPLWVVLPVLPKSCSRPKTQGSELEDDEILQVHDGGGLVQRIRVGIQIHESYQSRSVTTVQKSYFWQPVEELPCANAARSASPPAGTSFPRTGRSDMRFWNRSRCIKVSSQRIQLPKLQISSECGANQIYVADLGLPHPSSSLSGPPAGFARLSLLCGFISSLKCSMAVATLGE